VGSAHPTSYPQPSCCAQSTSAKATPPTAADETSSRVRLAWRDAIAAPSTARSIASPATRAQSQAPVLRRDRMPTPLAISRRPNSRTNDECPFIPVSFAMPHGATTSARPSPILNQPSPRANRGALSRSNRSTRAVVVSKGRRLTVGRWSPACKPWAVCCCIIIAISIEPKGCQFVARWCKQYADPQWTSSGARQASISTYTSSVAGNRSGRRAVCRRCSAS
jgi:hypothetical protein